MQRDKIDLEKALTSSNQILQQLMNNETPVLNEKLREKLIEGQKIPSFALLNLHKNDAPLTDGLKLLCRKSPSFVRVPPHYIWLQLQKHFDRSTNSLKSRVSFANKNEISSNNFRNNNGVNNPPEKKSNWHQKQIWLNLRHF